MKKHSILKRLACGVLAAATATALCVSTVQVSALVYYDSAGQLLNVTDFSDGEMGNWFIQTNEACGAKLDAKVIDQQLQVEIVNNGGADQDGGEGIWDAQLMYRPFKLYAGHNYQVDFTISASNAGKFYTAMTNNSGDLTIWHNCVGIKDEGFEDQWRTYLEVPANEPVHFTSTFTCASDLQYAKWTFMLGGGGEYYSDDCFPDGTILTFDDFSLYEFEEPSIPDKFELTDIPRYQMPLNEMIYNGDFVDCSLGAWQIDGVVDDAGYFRCDPIYPFLMFSKTTVDGVVPDMPDLRIYYPNLPFLRGLKYNIDIVFEAEFSGYLDLQLRDTETGNVFWEGIPPEQSFNSIFLTEGREYEITDSFVCRDDFLHTDLEFLLRGNGIGADKNFIIKNVSISCEDNAWMPLDDQSVVGSSFFEYSSFDPWRIMRKGDYTFIGDVLLKDDCLAVRKGYPGMQLEDMSIVMDSLSLKAGRTYQVTGLVCADQNGSMYTSISDLPYYVEQSNTPYDFWHNGYGEDNALFGQSVYPMNLEAGKWVSLDSTFTPTKDSDVAAWQFMFGGDGISSGYGFPQNTTILFKDLCIRDITQNTPKESIIGTEFDLQNIKGIYGDFNGDGKINISDVVLMSRFANEDGITMADLPRAIAASDVDGDSAITFDDVNLVLRHIARLD